MDNPKPDQQFDLMCPTCKCLTKQAHLEGAEWYCMRCAERHILTLDDTDHTLKAIAKLIAEEQAIAQKIV